MAINQRSTRVFVLLIILTIAFGGVPMLYAGEVGKVDLEAAEAQVVQLMGAPVSAGGRRIGVVSDISFGSHVKVDKIYVRLTSRLASGKRIVEIPASAFTVVRRTVVLQISMEEIQKLPLGQQK